MIKKIISLLFISTVPILVECASTQDFKKSSDQNLGSISSNNYRALSLKSLQEELKRCPRKITRSNAMKYMAELKTIEAFIVDSQNSDIILLGQRTSNTPPLYLDDFVIALRCAWKKYAKGNVFTPPGCSIDPRPSTLEALHSLGQKILRGTGSSSYNSARKKWNNICMEPQNVRVLGIPFHSHFADIMIRADYNMKRIIDGSDQLNIQGFTDMTTLITKDIQSKFNRGRTDIGQLSLMNRFWFYPDKYSFIEKDGIVMIDQCSIKLLTENQYLAKDGRNIGTGKTNPYAKKVAHSFTEKYDEIAYIRPIYGELKEQLRLYILAEALYFKSVKNCKWLDLSFLLNEYSIKPKKINATLPGQSRFTVSEYRRPIKNGTQTMTLASPVCGGVMYRIVIEAKNFIKDQGNRLESLKCNVLAQRPKDNSFFWDVRKK